MNKEEFLKKINEIVDSAGEEMKILCGGLGKKTPEQASEDIDRALDECERRRSLVKELLNEIF